MNIYKKFIFFALCVLAGIVNPTYAAQKNSLWWTGARHIGTFDNPNYFYEIFVQGRFRTTTDPAFERIILSGDIGQRVTQKMRLFLGYDLHTIQNASSEKIFYENRLWQKIAWNIVVIDFGRLSLNTRLEERTITVDSGIALRLREKLSFVFKPIINNKVIPIVSNEVLLRLTRPQWVRDSTVDQNRFFIGANFKAGKNNVFQIGYLNQAIFKSTTDQVNHIIYITLIH